MRKEIHIAEIKQQLLQHEWLHRRPKIFFTRKSKRTSQHGTKTLGHLIGKREQNEPHLNPTT